MLYEININFMNEYIYIFQMGNEKFIKAVIEHSELLVLIYPKYLEGGIHYFNYSPAIGFKVSMLVYLC